MKLIEIRWRSALIALASAALFMSTHAAGASELRIRVNADIRSSEPGVNRDANTDLVMPHIVEGLVAFKEDASIGNLLAKSVNVSPDGKTYTFVLRDDVRFHNGAPLTSADVLFAWGRYTDPKNGWRCLPDVDGETGLSKVLRVDAPDDKTVVFTLENPAALFLSTLARTDCAGTGIYQKNSLDANGKWISPIGTGPFKWGEWKKGQYVELLKNADYAARTEKRDGYTGDKTPLVDKVRFVIIPDDSAAKAALLSGGIDVIWDVVNTDVEELSSAKDIKISSAPGMGIIAYLFQTRDKLLSDVRIRRAIELSLDLNQIADVVSLGQAKANRSVIPTPSAYHGPVQSAVPARNLEEAKTLLAEAGYNGQPIKWLTTKYFPALFDSAVLAQAMLQEAGINVEVEVLDWATLEDRYMKGNYQATSYSYSARLDPSLSFDMMSGNKDKQPRKVWDNPKALELLAKSKHETDPTARQAILDEMEQMFRQDVPMVVLYSGIKVSAARADVSNYAGWSVGFPRAWGVSLAASN